MRVLNYISILLLLSGFSVVNAQNEMFIDQLVNKLVLRENFDKYSDLLNQQTFRTGGVIKTESYYELEVVTELYDQDGRSKDKYTTTYRCNPKETSIVLMAFPFSNPKSEETEINIISRNFKELYDLDSLKDIEIEMSFDSGLLNFFGSRSRIKIHNRVLKSTENQKQINSKINVKAYALGIRIKQLNYSVSEKLNSNGFLTYQKFIENDGSYFTIIYKEL